VSTTQHATQSTTETIRHRLVRDDVHPSGATTGAATGAATGPSAGAEPSEDAGRSTTASRRGRAWALTGPAAALAYLAGSIAGGVADPVYDPTKSGDAGAIMAALAEHRVALGVFHALTTVAGLLLLVFGAGLARRLRARLPQGSLLPGIASAGVIVTASVQVVGSSLDTEFIEGVTRPGTFVAESSALYGHWIGTVPYVWVTAGASALALAWAALRHRSAPRWLGVVSLLLGGASVVAGISPLQYVAGMTAPLWMLVVGLGLAFGDRAFRRGNASAAS